MNEVAEYAGKDSFDRSVHLALVDDLTGLRNLQIPARPLVLLVGADVSRTLSQELLGIASDLLAKGVVYAICWGPDCVRLEDAFDVAAAARDLDCKLPVVMTTSHANEALEEVLEFASIAAIPADEYLQECRTVLIAFVENVDWYNEAHNELEDLLHD